MSKTYEDAVIFASIKHKGQFRKGKIVKPYIEHPIAVSNNVNIYMKDDEERDTYVIAALLHDTLEDTNTSYDELYDNFGKEVADIVLMVTNDEQQVKKLGKNVYLANKMLNMDDKVLILKLCDRLDNIKDLVIANNDFIVKYMEDTSYIINSLLLNRKLNSTHLKLINEIMIKVKEISEVSEFKLKPKKKSLKIKEK